jgi:hypothetical protein
MPIPSLVVHFLCCVAASDRIEITSLLPNPLGNLETLVADGRYWVAPSNKLQSIKLIAGLSDPDQRASVDVKHAGFNWNGGLSLVEGSYDCWVEMVTKTRTGKILITRTSKAQVTVK